MTTRAELLEAHAWRCRCLPDVEIDPHCDVLRAVIREALDEAVNKYDAELRALQRRAERREDGR